MTKLADLIAAGSPIRGVRVTFSQKGREKFPRERHKRGVITKDWPRDGRCVFVKWDGAKCGGSIHASFIELENKDDVA